MVRITSLSARSDARGTMFPLDLPFHEFAETHVGNLQPGHLRGNHFHPTGRELLVILYSSRWTLYWDSGEGSVVESHVFEGSGGAQIEIEAGCAHAIVNDGDGELVIVSMADAVPVTVRREIAGGTSGTSG